MGTVTIDESPVEEHVRACIKVDDTVVMVCTDYFVSMLTFQYDGTKVSNTELALINHVNDMGIELNPQLESDLRDAIAYVGTLG